MNFRGSAGAHRHRNQPLRQSACYTRSSSKAAWGRRFQLAPGPRGVATRRTGRDLGHAARCDLGAAAGRGQPRGTHATRARSLPAFRLQSFDRVRLFACGNRPAMATIATASYGSAGRLMGLPPPAPRAGGLSRPDGASSAPRFSAGTHRRRRRPVAARR